MKKSWYKNKQIFVCGQNDLFEASVPDEFIERILEKARNSSDTNLYMFQTKNPLRFINWLDKFPKNSMLGTTIETNIEALIKEWSDAPSTWDRIEAMASIPHNFDLYVTIEPIMEFDLEMMWKYICIRIVPDKVFIGADSKGNNLPEPSAEKVKALIERLRKYTKVELKSNLFKRYPELEGLHG